MNVVLAVIPVLILVLTQKVVSHVNAEAGMKQMIEEEHAMV